jgi:hypothetical protein
MIYEIDWKIIIRPFYLKMMVGDLFSKIVVMENEFMNLVDQTVFGEFNEYLYIPLPYINNFPLTSWRMNGYAKNIFFSLNLRSPLWYNKSAKM